MRSRHYVTVQISPSRTGQRSATIWPDARLRRGRSLTRRDRQCRTGRFSPWMNDRRARVLLNGLPISRSSCPPSARPSTELRPRGTANPAPWMVCNEPCTISKKVSHSHTQTCRFMYSCRRAARKTELRELVESSQTQLETLRKQLETAEASSQKAQAALDTAQQELERALPFEKEVKEKNLLIGKLRHEAVILNDHLTKALRFLKKGKPEDNVDR